MFWRLLCIKFPNKTGIWLLNQLVINTEILIKQGLLWRAFISIMQCVLLKRFLINFDELLCKILCEMNSSLLRPLRGSVVLSEEILYWFYSSIWDSGISPVTFVIGHSSSRVNWAKRFCLSSLIPFHNLYFFVIILLCVLYSVVLISTVKGVLLSHQEEMEGLNQIFPINY